MPKDPQRKIEWQNIINDHFDSDLQLNGYSQVCALHFEPNCFYTGLKRQRVRLNKNAVPSIFDDYDVGESGEVQYVSIYISILKFMYSNFIIFRGICIDSLQDTTEIMYTNVADKEIVDLSDIDNFIDEEPMVEEPANCSESSEEEIICEPSISKQSLTAPKKK